MSSFPISYSSGVRKSLSAFEVAGEQSHLMIRKLVHNGSGLIFSLVSMSLSEVVHFGIAWGIVKL